MRRTIMIATSVVVAAGLGIVGGAAIAVVPTLLAPAGLTAPSGVGSAPMPAPKYSTNAEGETYGSALDAVSPGTEPDLIQAVASNGEVGYVRKTELDEANGTAAAAGFKSPAEALAWQQSIGSTDQTISVYAKDGTTVIGTFTVVGSASQSDKMPGQSAK